MCMCIGHKTFVNSQDFTQHGFCLGQDNRKSQTNTESSFLTLVRVCKVYEKFKQQNASNRAFFQIFQCKCKSTKEINFNGNHK